MSVLVIAEHDNQSLKPQTYQVISGAKELGDTVTVMVLGHDCRGASELAAKITGVSKVIELNSEAFANITAEDAARTISEYTENYDVVVAAATTFGKNLMPRLAAMCDVACISDVIEMVDENTFKRPIYAGNIIETVKSLDAKKILTLRTTAFDKAESGELSAEIDSFNINIDSKLVEFVSLKESQSDRPELTSANCVVSGGRALQSQENFELIGQLADCLNAAVGASRAAVDAGYVANDYQVGQTGKVVAPELYIAVGISGAIQHVAGMKDSKVIVAINKDEDAPIFQIANYGLKGDLFKLVPELIEKLKG